MFWKRTTTTTTNSPIGVLPGSQVTPPVQIVPVASVANPGLANATTYNPSYQSNVPAPAPTVASAVTYTPAIQPVVPVAVASVANPSIAHAVTYDRPLQPEVRHQDNYMLGKMTQLIWLVAGVLETLFAVRIILKLISANAAAGFAQFITNATAPFLAPFTGLMKNAASANGSVLEVTTLIAMLVYAFVAWGIVRLVVIVLERRIVR